MENDLFTSKDRRELTILDDYLIYGSGCNLPNNVEGDVWWITTSDCDTCKNDCTCHLFSRDKEAPPQNPDSWRHDALPKTKIKKDKNRIYRCFSAEFISLE